MLKCHRKLLEPPHNKTNKIACAPSEDSDQPGHPPSLIRVFAVHMNKALLRSNPLIAQRRLWSDWADAQADLSLRSAHSHLVGFVMRWPTCHTKIVSEEFIVSIGYWKKSYLKPWPYFNFYRKFASGRGFQTASVTHGNNRSHCTNLSRPPAF